MSIQIVSSGRSFTIDMEAGTLLRNHGEAISLSARQWNLLCLFVSEPRKIFSHSELLDQLWQKASVNQEVVGQAVRGLRAALGDDLREPFLIESVFGRGYRLIADIVEKDDAPPSGDEPPSEPTTDIIVALSESRFGKMAERVKEKLDTIIREYEDVPECRRIVENYLRYELLDTDEGIEQIEKAISANNEEGGFGNSIANIGHASHVSDLKKKRRLLEAILDKVSSPNQASSNELSEKVASTIREIVLIVG